ncbi:MAG TPA: crosslink repair DNA glycosylase YcaQ family protein, partial [Chitinophagaceae bacterium]|nr:crosslink repair DNA glycosylase YcaQ family protein [Chitinophagaceae bacterium]
MNNKDLLRLRLINHQIASTSITTVTGMVEWMIAMQAQEFAMAKWAIGLRLGNVTDALVEKAFNDGEILRTHAMRPTWHFVAPADIRWLQQLTGPRVHAGNAYVARQQKLDSKLVKR